MNQNPFNLIDRPGAQIAPASSVLMSARQTSVPQTSEEAYEQHYRILFPVDFYFDESGTHAGAPAFILAGYLAEVPAWHAFAERWKQTLTDAGIDSFHMHEFERRFRTFEGWSTERAVALQSRLIEIINETVHLGICCAISITDYEAITPPQVLKRHGLRLGFLMCFYECLLGIQGYMEERQQQEPVGFIFDQNLEYSPMMSSVFFRLKDHLGDPPWMNGIRFSSRKEYVQLQAADLLAYEMFKHLSHRLTDPERPMRKSLAALDTSRCMLKRLSREQIRAYTAEYWRGIFVIPPEI